MDRVPVGVAEAKKQGDTLSTVAEQSGRYAENLPDFLAALTSRKLPFLYESTGVEIFFRDERDPGPRSRRVFTFHRPETLAKWLAEPDTLRARFARLSFAHPLSRGDMRDCQFEANTGLEQSFAAALLRSLVQMATGAGKTYLACGFSYRLIRYAKASHILFLVDHANLGARPKANSTSSSRPTPAASSPSFTTSSISRRTSSTASPA